MTTNTPINFDIPTDREEMIRFFIRVERPAVRSFIGLVLFFGGILLMLPLIALLDIDDSRGWLFIPFLIALVMATYPVTKLYESTFGRRKATKRANRFKAMVEGCFLRIIDLDADRKIHFLQVVDYQTDCSKYSSDSSAATLIMSTNSGGPLVIPAANDALRMRDLLAEVDAERE